ncbi:MULTISPECIES: M24 family metallopeptidase [Thermomonospora]|uniref:Peptidase M24 n=1 Tax=Thermomonospora curvata (strain ATCC 19995 / DSM 43183 / JCM 3096 / KCTC 9072 / NBRC 15933 / NCIMB 10081 / Henssen B9) TaxID=471852 RepID=D1A7W4_THECD|nr:MULTISPECIES: Xaa-Pro peptidase family protein [Thermomonospora]ACY98486.1 peptidase M24 [Thermomonospora curvata DSM 43183]PKK13632.1 MAG: aminopeptidase P family protein [Thermomonospora sp. CIF 1]
MSDLHAERRRRLAGLVAADGHDAALITRLVNVRYLTGLASSNAALLVPADGEAVLATDSRYAGTAAALCPGLETVIDRDTAGTLLKRAAGAGVRTLAFEAHDLTVERHAELTEKAGEGTSLVPLGRRVEQLRTVKDESEIALLRQACAITDEAFAAVLPLIRPGLTERQLAVELERRMVDLGAEAPAFESIVAAGPNGAIPHHRPGDRPLAEGDLVTMDFGARCGGYHADMTRTVAIGRVADWQREIYQLVAAAQRAALQAIVPGADVHDVDAAARNMIDEAGHGADFPHGLGHGVGLEIHEAPLLGYGKTGKLSGRVPITAEPGVYLAGRGGVRIEDTLVVRADGPEILTKTTKDLLVV